MFRTTGQVVGVGITSSISQSVLTQRLTERLEGEDAAEVCRIAMAYASVESDLLWIPRSSLAFAIPLPQSPTWTQFAERLRWPLTVTP